MSATGSRTGLGARAARLREDGDRWVLPLLALVVLGASAVLMHAGRDTTFYFDDWNFVLERRDWSPHVLLYAHNEHLSTIPVVIYKLLLETVGMAEYAWYRAVLTLLVAAVGVLTFLYARPRIGPWGGIGLCAAVMLMGAGYWDLLWAFQIGFVFSIAAGLAALLLVDRGDRLGDVLASIALLLALASSSIGVPFVAAAVVEVVWRSDRAKRWWVVAAPLVIYGAWYLKYGKSAAKLHNLPEVPGWIPAAADDAAGALVGIGPGYGAILVVGLVAFVVRELLGEQVPPARLVALVALPLALWSATALARADMNVSPAESRYLFPGGLMLALIAVEVGRGRHLRGRAAGLFLAAALAVAVMGANALEGGGDQLRGLSAETRASLTALELAGDRVPAEALPVPSQPQLRAFFYREAARAYGSTNAYSLDELRGRPTGERQLADSALRRLLGIGVANAGANAIGTTAPEVRSSTGGTAAPARAGCVRFTPSSPDAELVVALPRNGLAVRSDGDAVVEVRLRRFAEGFAEEAAGSVPADGVGLVRVPADRAGEPWVARLSGAAPFSACGAR